MVTNNNTCYYLDKDKKHFIEVFETLLQSDNAVVSESGVFCIQCISIIITSNNKQF